jgi:hypothetical protein
MTLETKHGTPPSHDAFKDFYFIQRARGFFGEIVPSSDNLHNRQLHWKLPILFLTLFVGWFTERQFETADSASVKFSDR